MSDNRTEAHVLLEQVYALMERDLKEATKSMNVDDRALRVIIADNVIRRAVEVCLKESTPFDASFIPELALRFAATTLTALPEEAQEWGATQVAFGIHNATDEKNKRGGLRSEWDNSALN